jgi:hypothetical protein
MGANKYKQQKTKYSIDFPMDDDMARHVAMHVTAWPTPLPPTLFPSPTLTTGKLRFAECFIFCRVSKRGHSATTSFAEC